MKPRAGDIAYFESWVEGGDSYRVVVCYKYFFGIGGFGWYNVAGRVTPITERHPGLDKLFLLVRDGAQVPSVPHVDQFV